MATQNQKGPKPDGAAFDEFFESLGKKAENLTTQEQNRHKEATTNDAAPVESNDNGEPKIVDEIESLCMNCHENAC
jgi:zinc finger protein